MSLKINIYILLYFFVFVTIILLSVCKGVTDVSQRVSKNKDSIKDNYV